MGIYRNIMNKVSVDKLTQYITISPENPKASMIFLHGLGDTASGWFDTISELSKTLSSVRFILPTASLKPVTLNMGMKMPSWYDIKSLSDREDDESTGIEETKMLITELISKEIQSGIPANKIILGGFSQGGAVSLYTAYQNNFPIAGVIVLSGYIPNYRKFQVNDECKRLPLLMCHGDHDQVVRLEWAEKSLELLKNNDVKENIDWNIYKGMGHSACDEEINKMKSWIQKILKL